MDSSNNESYQTKNSYYSSVYMDSNWNINNQIESSSPSQNQYSWEYLDPSQSSSSSSKRQSNKWTNITFSGDTKIVNRGRYGGDLINPENDYQSMILQTTFVQNKNLNGNIITDNDNDNNINPSIVDDAIHDKSPSSFSK